MQTFAELAASRRAWIETVLRPWCGQASRSDLLAAAQEWDDIAGKVDAQKTLWVWAWGRFPSLVHQEMNCIDETTGVTVTLKEGTQVTGFPDARESTDGHLVLLDQAAHVGPFSIDDIEKVEKIADLGLQIAD